MEAGDERRDVHCFSASLSEHDLERVGGASPRPVHSIRLVHTGKQSLSGCVVRVAAAYCVQDTAFVQPTMKPWNKHYRNSLMLSQVSSVLDGNAQTLVAKLLTI